MGSNVTYFMGLNVTYFMGLNVTYFIGLNVTLPCISQCLNYKSVQIILNIKGACHTVMCFDKDI